jgi:hypothetical protein
MLKPDFKHLIEARNSNNDETFLVFAWAEVADVLSVNDAESLAALSDFHVWADEFVAKRIAWKPRHAADLIILKTYRLDIPIKIPLEEHHKGCKSWIDIEPPIDVSVSTAALPDSVWNRRVQEIRLSLSGSLTPPEMAA